jgi:hypothetical protein
MAIVKKISELIPKGSALGNTDLLIVGVDNGTDYDLKSVTGAQLLGTVVSQTITDGVTTKSPSENVVFDALDLKVDKVVGSRLITTAEGTVLGNTSGTNTGDETSSTIKTKLGITTLSGSNTGDQDLTPYATKSAPTFTGLTTLDTFKVTTGNYITPVDVVGIDVLGNVNRISASNGRTALGLGTLATQNGTFSGTSSGTNTGDQIISDATITTTDITTNNVSITKHGFAPKAPNNTTTFLRGDGTWATPSAGSSGGIWGIANSSGVYTYYATWALAVAAATSGQVIELFADITETTSTYILKNGVNVNGNGHTITFSTTTNGFDDNSVACTVVFSNITIIKTSTPDTAAIKCFNASSDIGGYSAIIKVTIGGVIGFYGSGTVWGFTVTGLGYSILTRFGTSLNINNCYVIGAIDGNGGTTIINNSYIKSSGTAVAGSPAMNNCTVIATGGGAYAGNGKNITNCSFISMTSNVISGGGIFENCYIYSAAERPINADVNAQFHNCYIESAVAYINQFNTGTNYYNCTLKSKLDVLFYTGTQKLYNCTLINEWNNSSGRITNGCVNVVMVNNYISIANSSAFVNYATSATNIYMYGNAIKGTSNINSAVITNLQTNTADAQGNIILN